MQPNAILSCLLPVVLATASPVHEKRAGGPSSVSIPSNCTVISPIPHSTCTKNASGYSVSKNFTAAHEIYSAYYESSSSTADLWTQCSQQCYGFGNRGQCKSALLGHNVPTPAGYYGTAGGVLEVACLLFDDYLTPLDFVAAPKGQYTDEKAGSLYCP